MENKNFTLSKKNELRATKSELEFILEHCEKQLIESLKSADEVLNRSTVLVGLLFTIITSCIGYLAINAKIEMHTPFYWSIIFVTIYTGYLLNNIKPNIMGGRYRTLGREAKNVFHNDFFNGNIDAALREKSIYIDCIDRYQGSIEWNNEANKPRWYRFRETLTLTTYIPIIFIAVYLLLFLYSPTA